MKVVRADSGQSGSSAKLSLSNLPAGLVQKASARVCWIALACAATTVAMTLLQRVLQPEVAQLQKQLAIQLNTAFILVFSIGLFSAGRFGWLSANAILHLGLVLEVLIGYAIAAFEYSIPWDPQQPVRGISWMALWIAMCGLLIPNRHHIMLIAALVTASMGPLAYAMFHPAPIPINRLVIWNMPNFLVAAVTVLISRRLYHLEAQVQRAKEMGSYQLDTLIGKGGMGEVWRASHRMLARDSAIKLIRPEMLVRATGKQAEMIRRRFEREAKTTAALKSPHTVGLYDFGTSEDGGFYYVMELLDGIDLETLVKQFGPQPPGRIVHVLRQVSKSLAEAHNAGLIHRDIKPTNIFLCRLGVEYDFAKVLDFGLVKTALDEGAMRMTMEGVTTGTPAYMPPEIAMGNQEIDGRADLYGLGCVAYWLLTGTLPFNEKSSMAMILAHVQTAPVPPSERITAVIPLPFERVVMACLAKKPEDRPRNAEAFARMLDECQTACPWTQADAELWWRTHLPGGAIQQTNDSLQKTSTSTMAMRTM